MEKLEKTGLIVQILQQNWHLNIFLKNYFCIFSQNFPQYLMFRNFLTKFSIFFLNLTIKFAHLIKKNLQFNLKTITFLRMNFSLHFCKVFRILFKKNSKLKTLIIIRPVAYPASGTSAMAGSMAFFSINTCLNAYIYV